VVVGLDLRVGGVRALAGRLTEENHRFGDEKLSPGNPTAWLDRTRPVGLKRVSALFDVTQQLDGHQCSLALGLSGQMHGMVEN